jgi:hypothetical protein
MNNFFSTGEFVASKSLWLKWVTAFYAIQKSEVPDNWQEELEAEFKKLSPSVTSIKWIE